VTGEFLKLSHGAGGTLMDEVIRKTIMSSFSVRKAMNGVGIDELDDGSSLRLDGCEIVTSMDGHTVSPIFSQEETLVDFLSVGPATMSR
jgi:hydrogenase expression/formation protein HypE